MTPRKYVDRKTVLKAIRAENLRSGNWVVEGNPDTKDCQVCAVGAVLRHAGMNNEKIRDAGEILFCIGNAAMRQSDGDHVKTMNAVVKDLLAKGYYLNALSVKFEWHADKLGTGKRIKDILCKFVKENFPDKIRLIPEI